MIRFQEGEPTTTEPEETPPDVEENEQEESLESATPSEVQE